MRVVVSVGGKFHAMHLARELETRGVLERLITTKRWYAAGIPASKVKAIPVPEYVGQAVRSISWWRKRGYYSYVKDNLFDVMARRYVAPCDVFHAWGNYALYSIPRAREFGAKVVIERGSTHPHFQDEILREEARIHGFQIERAHPQIIEKGLEEIALADRVIIPSEFVRKSFLLHGVPEEKLRVIPYGIDLTRFRNDRARNGIFRVLFVGNIGFQKGIHYLLDAWSRLRLPDAELVLIGSIEQDAQTFLQRYQGQFIYKGHVRHEELVAEYNAASVFVLPSLQEGSALVTYEAMACGLPCVVTENTGSIVRDGVDGMIIPVRSSRGLEEAISWMFEHPSERQEMGDQAVTQISAYTWMRYADGVLSVYPGM